MIQRQSQERSHWSFGLKLQQKFLQQFCQSNKNSFLASIRALLHADVTRIKKSRSCSSSFTLHSFDIFVGMRSNFQSLFSNLDILYPSMLTKPKGKQITASKLNKTFPSGRSIIKNLPQRTQSIAKIPFRFFCYLFKTSMDNSKLTFSKSGSSSPLRS